MEILTLAVGFILAALVGAIGALVVYRMVRNQIDISKLISEPAPVNDASLSRFQFLVFTFVIAMSFFLVVIGQKQPTFPDVPPGVLALLGISGGSYIISKGIQTARDTSPTLAGQPKHEE